MISESYKQELKEYREKVQPQLRAVLTSANVYYIRNDDDAAKVKSAMKAHNVKGDAGPSEVTYGLAYYGWIIIYAEGRRYNFIYDPDLGWFWEWDV